MLKFQQIKSNDDCDRVCACVRACVRACVGCVSCTLLSCRSGTAHADRSLWRAALQEREPASTAAEREQRRARRTGVPQRTKQAGIMEKRPSLPSNGLRLLTSLLTLYGLTCVSSNQVVVPENVNAVLGKNITLGCRIEVGSNLSLTQSSWERRLPSGTITLAVFNPEFGISIAPEYVKRVSFVSPSVRDATISIEGAGFSDIGSYICKVATFPLGNTQASTTVNVLVEPKVYVSAGPTALLDGGNESLVATCIAERGRPAAEVFWETELYGRSEKKSQDEANGTSTTHVSYMWQPQSYAQGKTLTCVVRHPALQTEFRIPYVLNVQFAPMVSVTGTDKNWFAGQENVKFTCASKANPPARNFTWIRLDGLMPEGVEISNSTFAFTRPLGRNDSGVYRCEVLNDVGLRSKEVNLWVQGPGGEPHLDITHNITAVLGEDVYLRCRYMGEGEILSATWKRQINTRVKSRPLAGFTDDKPFSRSSDFSEPESVTNLTVKMNVSSVDTEGKYICEFESEEESYSDSVFLTVVARPEIHIQVSAETINGTHYQSVSCSAVGGRPASHISWLVADHPSSDHPLTQHTGETVHPNGTSTVSSTLRFPTHLQDEDSVVCIVQHPTLPSPTLTTVRVETYTRPNVTIKAEMVQRGGSDFWVVSCISSGGRPDTEISLALNREEEQQREDSTDSDTQTSSVLLPADLYEGHNVTCLFDHPKFKQRVSRVITLPSFYISGVHLLYSELQSNYDNSLELREGQSDIVISLQVTGNVPRYNVTCKKDDGPLPDGVEIIGSSLALQGPLEQQHAGVFECFFSYHQLQANLTFNVTVKPPVTEPIPPAVRVDVQTKDGRRVIECSAADAVPAANMSWLLPEGVSGVSWFNFTSHNGSHSVRGVLLLPACSPRELSAECVINHPAFKEPQNRSITLPLCAHPNITINSSTEWKNGDKYMNVDCSVDSVATAASITWHVGATESSISPLSETLVHSDGSVSFRSSVHFMSSLYSGHNLTCMVEHPSLEAAEKRTIRILVHKAPQLSVSVVRQQDSLLWLAVCDCRGEGDGANLAWLLPENAKEQTSLHSESEGRILKARLTYQFALAPHEGQNLTCVYQFKHGAAEKTIHIPRYYISSLRVLNRTTPLQSRYGGEPVVNRLALQENHQNQRVLLQVEGNVPEYNLNCKRSDGLVVQMNGAAMVFPSELTEQDEGLYTCRASFYHHTASVNIQVEVACQDKQLALVIMICLSSALAIVLILVVTLWVCCKTNDVPNHKKRESLSALTTLMQEPSSPGAKKPSVTEKDSKEYAQLISYSIVIDVKSDV
ncbi:uncharacterized protein si:ch211-149e23.4 isoform X2 [Labrus bergylta]|uniref:uncharacterized protein si:ch211-149e23.4 isoform X2 n=1 Tax=Labrus bergylta TaxID=56723 RepID=UPI0033140729